MRKIVFFIVFILMGVLLLSSTARLTEDLYVFFDDDSSLNSDSNKNENTPDLPGGESGGDTSGGESGGDTSGGESGGDASGGESGGDTSGGESGGDTSGGESGGDSIDITPTLYQRTDTKFGYNYKIDTSTYFKMGNFYYYSLKVNSDMYVKCAELLDSNGEWYTDLNDYTYEKLISSVAEDTNVSIILDLSGNSISNDFYNKYNIELLSFVSDHSIELHSICEFSDSLYYSSIFSGYGYFYIVKINPPDVRYDIWELYEGSNIFGFTTFEVINDISNVYSDVYFHNYDM